MEQIKYHGSVLGTVMWLKGFIVSREWVGLAKSTWCICHRGDYEWVPDIFGGRHDVFDYGVTYVYLENGATTRDVGTRRWKSGIQICSRTCDVLHSVFYLSKGVLRQGQNAISHGLRPEYVCVYVIRTVKTRTRPAPSFTSLKRSHFWPLNLLGRT